MSRQHTTDACNKSCGTKYGIRGYIEFTATALYGCLQRVFTLLCCVPGSRSILLLGNGHTSYLVVKAHANWLSRSHTSCCQGPP